MLLASRLFRCRNGEATGKLARHVQYPASSDVDAIASASYFLVPFGSNNVGQSDRFSFYIR